MKKSKMKSILKKALSTALCGVIVSATMVSPSTAFAASKVKKTTVTSVKAKSSSSIVVKWKKVSGIKGYVIYQKKAKAGFKKVKTITKAKTTSYTKKGLKANTKYSYKIKTYKVKNGKKVYSVYSNTKSATTKKNTTSKPGSTPTKLTQADYRNKVADRIESHYDMINSSGQKLIRGVIRTNDGAEVVSAIIYDKSSDKLYFSLRLYYPNVVDGNVSLTTMTLDVNSNDTKTIVYDEYDIGSESYESYANIYLSSYDLSSVNFTIESRNNMTYDEVQESSNIDTQLAMILWDAVLIDKTGYTLKDLGFSKLSNS